jgi:transposase-like protein
VLDFEQALGQGFEAVFRRAKIYRDYFHFVQAQTRKMAKLKYKQHKAEVVTDVRALWYASSEQQFYERVNKFLDKWSKIVPDYATYFEKNWAKRDVRDPLPHFPPVEWASYGRPPNALSGMLLFCL